MQLPLLHAFTLAVSKCAWVRHKAASVAANPCARLPGSICCSLALLLDGASKPVRCLTPLIPSDVQGCTVLAMDLMENGSLWMGLTRKGKDGKPLFQWNQRWIPSSLQTAKLILKHAAKH